MNSIMKLISWTGWTKQDWIDFLYIFSPVKLISWTGWTKEDWIECVVEVMTGFCAAALFFFIVLAFFVAGLAVI